MMTPKAMNVKRRAVVFLRVGFVWNMTFSFWHGPSIITPLFKTSMKSATNDTAAAGQCLTHLPVVTKLILRELCLRPIHSRLQRLVLNGCPDNPHTAGCCGAKYSAAAFCSRTNNA